MSHWINGLILILFPSSFPSSYAVSPLLVLPQPRLRILRQADDDRADIAFRRAYSCFIDRAPVAQAHGKSHHEKAQP